VRIPTWITIGLGLAVFGLSLALGLVASGSPDSASVRVIVPHLAGLSRDSVRAQTDDLGLVLNLTSVSSCRRHGQGTGILSQTPAPGTPVASGSTISAIWSTVFCH
jgi:beta-lactam-binding protein with PASTA domain